MPFNCAWCWRTCVCVCVLVIVPLFIYFRYSLKIWLFSNAKTTTTTTIFFPCVMLLFKPLALLFRFPVKGKPFFLSGIFMTLMGTLRGCDVDVLFMLFGLAVGRFIPKQFFSFLLVLLLLLASLLPPPPGLDSVFLFIVFHSQLCC